VCGCAQQPVLQVALHSIGDSCRYNQRCNTGRYAGYGNQRNQTHHRLTPLGSKITSGNVKLKA
jgi:hypothetical protein